MGGPGPEAAAAPSTESAPSLSAPSPEPIAIVQESIDEDSALKLLLKSDPEAAKRYRSPRKAFFFSLLLPGAGQAYVGSWAKMTLFAAAEIGLGVGWYQVAIVASREKAREAERFAAQHWRQQRYETQWKRLFASQPDSGSTLLGGVAPMRSSYCASIYRDESPDNYKSCVDAPTERNAGTHAQQFSKGGLHSDSANAWSADSVLNFRANNIKDLDRFHDLVGRYDEFLGGWEDSPDTVTTASLGDYYNALVARAADPSLSVPVSPWGFSKLRNEYRSLRQRSNDLAATQKYFLGGMILNHIVAAVDAALQATRMNRRLLKLETTWIDRIELDGGMAVIPDLSTRASVAWRF